MNSNYFNIFKAIGFSTFFINTILFMVLCSLLYENISKRNENSTASKFQIFLLISVVLLCLFIGGTIIMSIFCYKSVSLSVNSNNKYLEIFKFITVLTITYSVVNSFLLWKEYDAMIESIPQPIMDPLYKTPIATVFKLTMIIQAAGSSWILFKLISSMKQTFISGKK